MAITPYATLDDLGAYLGSEPPADCARLLARAQDLVDAAMTGSMYAIDAAGENPTDAAVVAALRKATCAQVEWWLADGDEFDQMTKFSSFSIEGISVARASGVGPRQYRLCDRAWDALRAAKLLPGTVFST